ncbi:MAG: glycosyltransferase family 4 protein [Patescibacteria group bacterium]|jgi:glycosyltransferase involved in cell wall biosynthesis
MENGPKVKIALVRGDSLNEWEGKLWGKLPRNFDVTGFCSANNLYDAKSLSFPVKTLRSTGDNFFINNICKYGLGVFQKMYGLENELKDFEIAHTAEISYFYTLQAVRAKKINPKLKVVTTVWDNSFGRFEYNYIFGLKAPQFWVQKMLRNMQEIVEGVDMFLPVSNLSAATLTDLGVDQKKITILTPAVDSAGEPKKKISDYAPHLEGKQPYFMVCRLVKEKGVYDVLYAWKMLKKENKAEDKVLLIVGKGPEEQNMRRLVAEWHLEKLIIFLGLIPNSDLKFFYRDAKALILASLPGPLWQEQFGYVIAEAINQGCPVVSTYSGAIPEVIGNAGLLFSPGNPVELKNCLKKLDDVNVYRQLQTNCETVKEKFLTEKFVSRLIEIYTNLK